MADQETARGGSSSADGKALSNMIHMWKVSSKILSIL
jgi:hypothetical protein